MALTLIPVSYTHLDVYKRQDQHFNRRARLQRLLAAMEDAGENEGFGISEDTALEVSLSDRALRVHGSAYVLSLIHISIPPSASA